MNIIMSLDYMTLVILRTC